MFIGIDCFCDDEIRSMILSSSIKGKCDITGKENVFIYDTESCDTSLSDYLSELIDVYTPESELISFPKEKLASIEVVLKRDWSIFTVSESEIKIILIEVCKKVYPSNSKVYSERVGLEELGNIDYMEEFCLTKRFSWNEFVDSLKTINRFHSTHINLKQLKRLFENPCFRNEIPKGVSRFCRGRISDSLLKPREMWAPPVEKVVAGRANSSGIRCLYLAGDEETALHEIRARDLDIISIGVFETKHKSTIVDLANLDQISPSRVKDVFTYEWLAINMPVLKKMSKEIAKPLRRQDSELDYLPSQYISDYIKSLGYDGIQYKSTLHTDGMNYAIFNQKKFKCIDVYCVQVLSLKYKSMRIM